MFRFGTFNHIFNVKILAPYDISSLNNGGREQSSREAMTALAVICEDTVVVPLSMEMFRDIYSMVRQIPDWQGSLEDASVVAVAKLYDASVWTLDYRDLSWFKSLELWFP